MSSVELLSVHNFVTEIQRPKWRLKVQCLGGTNLSHGSYISVGSLFLLCYSVERFAFIAQET